MRESGFKIWCCKFCNLNVACTEIIDLWKISARLNPLPFTFFWRTHRNPTRTHFTLYPMLCNKSHIAQHQTSHSDKPLGRAMWKCSVDQITINSSKSLGWELTSCSEVSTPPRPISLMLRLHTESIARGQRHCEQILHILEHELHHLLKLRVVAHFLNQQRCPMQLRVHLHKFPPSLPSALPPSSFSWSALGYVLPPTVPLLFKTTVNVKR